MNAETKKILAKALLLSKQARKELTSALDQSIGETEIHLSNADLFDTSAIVDEFIEEANKEGQRRRRWDWDVPEVWRSDYYLRRGYHIDRSGRSRRDHWQGGAPLHKRAVCLPCGEHLHLLWDINCTDSRFRKESSQVFGKLERLPLYYCLHCPSPTVYRCSGKHRLQMIESEGADFEESPFPPFQTFFRARHLYLKRFRRTLRISF
jgi:hypothetical protein